MANSYNKINYRDTEKNEESLPGISSLLTLCVSVPLWLLWGLLDILSGGEFKHNASGVNFRMKRRVTIEEAAALVPTPEGKRFATALEHGSLLVEIYAPHGTDPQQPHTRDEAYIVVQGSGEFINGESRGRFGAGDFLFVPAGVEHRFVDFTDDLLVWVIFYGPEGGEANQA
jgi:mannose-6-phosphate isomerase-like protein (cupin superfamily)